MEFIDAVFNLSVFFYLYWVYQGYLLSRKLNINNIKFLQCHKLTHGGYLLSIY